MATLDVTVDGNLTSLTAPDRLDRLMITKNSSTSLQDMELSVLQNGWLEVSDTWTYASATTITVPSDATAIYQRWMRIRLKQGGAYKYYVALTVAETLLTIVTNTSYTVADAAITDIAVSFIEKPLGFPDEFDWLPAWTNLTAGSATVTAKLKVGISGCIQGHVEMVWAADTSISGAVSTSALPVARGTYGGSAQAPVGKARFYDATGSSFNGDVLLSATTLVLVCYNTASTYSTLANLSSSVPFTWTTSDEILLDFCYFG